MFSPIDYARCTATVRSPVSTHGLSHPEWVAKTQQFNPDYTDAVVLHALNGVGYERNLNAIYRDSSNRSVIVEQRPVFQFPDAATRESDSVPAIWKKQIENSCGLDIGRDQLYVSADYNMYCTGDQI